MKFYRAIEFSKLQFLLKDEEYLHWVENDLNFQDKYLVNWWLQPDQETVDDRSYFINKVAEGDNNVFFEKSAEFNSVTGGRFNPSKSFGGIYCSNSYILGGLEVLYHDIVGSVRLLKPMLSNKGIISTKVNRNFGNTVKTIIVVFEFEIEDEILQEYKNNIYDLNATGISGFNELRNLCKELGFSRYLSNGFNRQFIYGNDYSISQIIGCNLHARDYKIFSVPSARLDIGLQYELNLKNYFIPESALNLLKPKLSKKFIEIVFEYENKINSDLKYSIDLLSLGDSEVKEKFELESYPNKKYQSQAHQIITFSHDVSMENKKFREVHLQSFVKKQT